MTGDELLNVAARLLLRTCSPVVAHSVLRNLGRLLPKRTAREDVRLAASELRGKGTCLSRALALAATAPQADVVIGVKPEGRSQIHAHAWLEMGGQPLDPSDPSGQEIARLCWQSPAGVTDGRPVPRSHLNDEPPGSIQR